MTRSAKPTESQIQSAFIAWTRLAQSKYPTLRLAFSVPNGAWTRNYATAVKLRKEGLRAGVPDWMLPYGNANHHGLAIEFKRPGAKPTKQQLEYHGLLRLEYWRVEVCDDWEKAKEIVEDYLT